LESGWGGEWEGCTYEKRGASVKKNSREEWRRALRVLLSLGKYRRETEVYNCGIADVNSKIKKKGGASGGVGVRKGKVKRF